MKQILFIMLSLHALAGCAQNKDQHAQSNTTMTQTLSKPEANFNSLKKYDQEPIYQVTVNTENFAYQVLVNDLPVYTNTGKYGGQISFFINQAILQSGNQVLMVRLMPRPGQERLTDSKDFKLQVARTAWQKGGGMVEPVPVLAYELPELSNNKQAQFKNEKEFSNTLSFDATVPYKLNGWTSSLPLKKDERLKEEVMAAYNSMIADFGKKDGRSFMAALGNAELLVDQANYFSPAEAKQRHEEWVAFVNKGERPIAPLENYEMELAGNGKLVRFKRTDEANKGEGVLRMPYQQNGRERIVIYDVYFHRPAGSGRLEAIWYYMMDRN